MHIVCPTHLIDPAWSERVRTQCHVSVAHTLMEESQDPEMSQSPRLTKALTASWCPFKRVERVNEHDCLRGLLRDDSTPIRPAALLWTAVVSITRRNMACSWLWRLQYSSQTIRIGHTWGRDAQKLQEANLFALRPPWGDALWWRHWGGSCPWWEILLAVTKISRHPDGYQRQRNSVLTIWLLLRTAKLHHSQQYRQSQVQPFVWKIWTSKVRKCVAFIRVDDNGMMNASTESIAKLLLIV